MSFYPTSSPVLRRMAAGFVVLALVSCQAPGVAFAAKGSSSASSSASSSVSASSDSGSLSAPSTSKSKDEKTEAEKKAEKERKEKEEKAGKKRDEAKSLHSQADAVNAALKVVQAERDEAARALDAATAEREGANGRLEEENRQIESLESELSDFVVDMYKQGGMTPYLDVMLGATSYREFLTSWNMTLAVSEHGQAIAAEKKQRSRELEAEIAALDEQVAEAERTMTLADSKRKQIEGTQLALRAQATALDVQAAEILGDKDEIASAKEAAKAAQAALDDAIAAGLAGEGVLEGDGFFTNPCPGYTLSSGFGYRSFDHSVHKGLDMAAASGTPYYAADSGTVTAATNDGGDNGGAGNWIVIDHGNGFVTKYMHSLTTFVKPGDHVERGQNIGLVGSTGQSTGPHLHFQVEVNGVAVDPTPYL